MKTPAGKTPREIDRPIEKPQQLVQPYTPKWETKVLPRIWAPSSKHPVLDQKSHD